MASWLRNKTCLSAAIAAKEGLMSFQELESSTYRASDNSTASRSTHLLKEINQNDWQSNLFPTADTASCHLPHVSLDGSGNNNSSGHNFGPWADNPAAFMFGSSTDGSPAAADSSGQR